jgi:glutamine synthetase
MRNTDRRPVAQGGAGSGAPPLVSEAPEGFVQRHELWGEADYAAAAQLWRVVEEVGVELVRFAFADQHGVLRGKTITREELQGALRSGVTAPSSLLLKDTSGKSVFSVFSAQTGVGVEGFSGAGDIVLVADPATFTVLPWTERTASVLCDLYFPDGAPVLFSPRGILRRALAPLAGLGYGLTVGAELEFHVFRATTTGLHPGQVGRPGAPGFATVVEPLSAGSQLLHEETLDGLDEIVQLLHRTLTRMDLPLRSIELEFGPNQLEITMAPQDALATADSVLRARSAIRQVCRRSGFHATFMSRPAGSDTASAGWHLHQSLRRLDTGASVFMPGPGGEALSPVARHYLAGLLDHAAAAAVFSTPTVNGYKRYQPYSLAPDRVCWGIDNKGAMIRAVGHARDPATRLENRCGEPAANPYLYIAAQAISGLDGIRRQLDPGPPTRDPYGADAPRLPQSLAVALDALAVDPVFADALGADVLTWYSTIKRAEFDRYLAHVSDWEQREYFDLF